MTRKERAKELVGRHLEVLKDSHMMHDMTDMEMEIIAEHNSVITCDVILGTVYVNTDSYQTEYWNEIKKEIDMMTKPPNQLH